MNASSFELVDLFIDAIAEGNVADARMRLAALRESDPKMADMVVGVIKEELAAIARGEGSEA